MARTTDKSETSTLEETLGEITRLLVEAAHPRKVILFGSYARGDFDARSDLDLLVIMDRVDDRFGEMARLRLALRPIPSAFDIVVYSCAEFEARRDLPGTMLYHALREGRVLYDIA